MSGEIQTQEQSAEDSLSEGLNRLFAGDDASEEDYIPGEGDTRPPPAPLEKLGTNDLARLIRDAAHATDSATAKTRGLTIASQLFAHCEKFSAAETAAREGAEASPKLSFASLLLRKYSRSSADRPASANRPASAEGPTAVDSVVERSLESVSRLATHAESRRHASRMLLRLYAADNQIEQIGKLLDQTARGNEPGLPIVLERAVHRAAEGASLAGVTVPPEFEVEFYRAFEVVTGQPLRASREEAPTANDLAPELALIRAARRLHRGEGATAIEPLLQLHGSVDSPFGPVPPSRADLLELSASLRAAEDGGVRDAAVLLNEAYASTPSRRILRNLAARIIELDDKDWLSSLLAKADPGSGTFAIEERIILASLSGTPLTLGETELAQLATDQETLARALAPLKKPALDLKTADSEKLLIQLGAGLKQLRREPDQATDALAALEELEVRGEAPLLSRAIRTGLALLSGSPAELSHAIRELTGERDDARSHLIIGALFERIAAKNEASSAYQKAANLTGNTRSATIRGLQALSQNDESEALPTHEAATLLANDTVDNYLRFSRRLSLALAQTPADRGEEIAFATRQFLEDADPSAQALARPLALAGALYAKVTHAGRPAVAQTGPTSSDLRTLYETLAHEESFIGTLCLLRQFYDTGRSVRALTQTTTRKISAGDATERALATWLDFEVDHSPVDGDVEKNRAQALFAAVTQLATGTFARASESLRLHSSDFSAMTAIADDVSEIEGDTVHLTPLWLDRAQSAGNDSEKRYAYERLATLDERRGDLSSATLWRKTLAEQFPSHAPSVLSLEEHFLKAGEVSESTQEKLAELLPPGDREAYQIFAGTRSLANSDLRSARKHLEPLLTLDKPPKAALRGLATVARDRRDDELLLTCLQKLAEFPSTDLDKASMELELGHLYARSGRADDARTSAKQALLQKPNNFSAAWLLESLSQSDDALEQAEVIEAFARAAVHQSHRAELWFAAAEAWLRANDVSRAAPCFEQTLQANPSSLDAFTQLCAIRHEENRHEAVRDLLEARLLRISSTSPEALELELKLADLLATQGDPDAAKKHLERALLLQPNNANALRSHAYVSALLGAHESAERSLVALRDKLAPSPEKTAVLRTLARLYDTQLGQLEKAMDAYQEVLHQDPDDEETTRSLIDVFSRLGFAERATTLQTQLIQKANTPEKKRAAALGLAAIYENVAQDIKRAGATLERTRKAWPLDAEALEATVRFMDRHGSDGSRGFLLDRVGKEARRALEGGPLDETLVDTLARVAQLSGRISEAEGCIAARAALTAHEHSALNGAGVHALNSRVDEIIAPQGLAAPLRNLLRKTGQAMDAAFSVDLGQLGAAPLRQGAIFDRVAQMAEALRIPAPQLFISTALGARCLPLTTMPARLLVGSQLDFLGGRERDYLLLRGFKLLDLGVGALARSRDEDRWPMLAALLQLFAPNWQPPSVDARKAAQAKAAIEQGLARVGYDDDVPTLALEAIGSIGDQPGSLGEATRVLANRAALIAVGDLTSVLSAIAAGEGVTLSEGGPSRSRWIETHHEARDLVLFSCDPKHARAREGLGLAEKTFATQASQSLASMTPPLPSRVPAVPSRIPAPSLHRPQPAEEVPAPQQAAPHEPLLSRAPPMPSRRPKPPSSE